MTTTANSAGPRLDRMIAVRIPAREVVLLDVLGAATDRGRSEVVRDLIATYVRQGTLAAAGHAGGDVT